MSNTPNARHLYAALAAARAELQALPREGRYQFGSYMRAEDAIAIAREVLARHEIVLLVRDVGVSPVGDGVYLCTTTAELVHAPTGAAVTLTRSVPSVAQRGRPADKAALAAQTTTLGYLIRDVLLAPRREPYEIETLPDQAHDTPAPPPPPPPAFAPLPASPPTPPPAAPQPERIPPQVIALANMIRDTYRELQKLGDGSANSYIKSLETITRGDAPIVRQTDSGGVRVDLRVVAQHADALRDYVRECYNDHVRHGAAS